MTRSFLVTFLMGIGILTFGMTGARLVKIFEYMSSGVPASVALTFLVYIMPIALSFTIPWAALVAIMLIFGRMSADNEITAMRACGISVLQIISPIIIITFLLTCLCLYLQVDIGPTYAGRASNLIKEVGVNQPTALLEAGRPVEFERFRIYIEEKNGTDLRDIQVFKMSEDWKKMEQDITAARGKIELDKENQRLDIVLENATVVSYDNDQLQPQRTIGSKMTFSIDYGKKFNQIQIGKKAKHMSFHEIFARTALDKRRGIDTTRLEVELNQRVAMALSPIAFLLLGMPLAIRTSRRETSIGLFLSVILAGAYFGAVLISDSLQSRPQYYPQYLVWIPAVIYQIFGAYYLFKIARK